MGQKRYTAEQIIDKLRQAEVGLSSGYSNSPNFSPNFDCATCAIAGSASAHPAALTSKDVRILLN